MPRFFELCSSESTLVATKAPDKLHARPPTHKIDELEGGIELPCPESSSSFQARAPSHRGVCIIVQAVVMPSMTTFQHWLLLPACSRSRGRRCRTPRLAWLNWHCREEDDGRCIAENRVLRSRGLESHDWQKSLTTGMHCPIRRRDDHNEHLGITDAAVALEPWQVACDQGWEVVEVGHAVLSDGTPGRDIEDLVWGTMYIYSFESAVRGSQPNKTTGTRRPLRRLHVPGLVSKAPPPTPRRSNGPT